MIKNWIPERKDQYKALFNLVEKVGYLNQTTSAIDDIQQCIVIARILRETDYIGEDSFMSFLHKELTQ